MPAPKPGRASSAATASSVAVLGNVVLNVLGGRLDLPDGIGGVLRILCVVVLQEVAQCFDVVLDLVRRRVNRIVQCVLGIARARIERLEIASDLAEIVV